MTELRNPTSSQTSSTATASKSVSAEADPLHNLYRMSRTAGLGSGDYVAVNNTSVLALLLSLASLLSLLSPWVLVVCVAAIVCGVLALKQIRSSNGTQTGSLFAV